jgi:hypothetical protein
MSLILGVLFLGLTFLTGQISAIPSEEETVISQLARTVFAGRGFLYLAMISATTVILIMAANTAFADFPRLSALVAHDGFLPRQLTFRGSRLVYSYGITALSMIASLLILLFKASVTALIPLYAIGVFLSFTLSQSGMARRWWKIGHLSPGAELKERGSVIRFEKGWQYKMVVNGFGALCTIIVAFIFAVTKFKDGAYIVIFLTPALVGIFLTIHRHYRNLAQTLSLDDYGEPMRVGRHRVIMPLSGVHRGSLSALHYAQSLSYDVTVVHVSIDPVETEKVRRKWDKWGNGIRLVVLESPYRLFMEPLLEYIDEIDQQRQQDEIITIVVPQFVPQSKATEMLHMRTADYLRNALMTKEGIVITSVPYQVK